MSNKAQRSIVSNLNREFLNDFLDALIKKKKVKVTNLGIFEIVKQKGRVLYHPLTKKEITISDFNKLRFTPTQRIKDIINGIRKQVE